MKKVNIYIIASIIIFTVAVVIYLMFKANEIQQYAMARAIDITPQKGLEAFIHTLGKTLSNIFGN